MDANNNVALAKLASSVKMAAKEAARTIGDICNNTEDPPLQNLQQDFSYFADACHFLSLQLSKADPTTIDWDYRFWTSLRLVLELWLRNTEYNLTYVREYHKRRDSTWTGWLFSSPRFTRLAEDYEVVNVDARMEDAQMLIALFNFHSKLQNEGQTHDLCFLSRDLEWKAARVQTRTSRYRNQHNLPSNWGQTQSIIAEVAMATAAQAKTLYKDTGGPPDINSMDSKT